MRNNTVGIDRISMYTPAYYLDMRDLAQARGVDPDKFTIGIGQSQQSVIPSSHDIVTMGAQAVMRLRDSINDSALGLIILGTESGVDASKAGALYIQQLTNLPHTARVMEIKEACYGGTAGLMTACDYVRSHPEKQALVIASDIARYGLNTPGEVTQGGGAIAMLITSNPHILEIDSETSVYSDSIQDFWRPVYTDEAQARGKYSTEQYLEFFEKVWKNFSSSLSTCDTSFDKPHESLNTYDSRHDYRNYEAFLFHLPYTKMGAKALQRLCEITHMKDNDRARFEKSFELSTRYSRRVGNMYTGSLYMSLLSFLESEICDCDNNTQNYVDTRDKERSIALFSYGSGAIGELFIGRLVPGYESALYNHQHQELLDNRHRVSVEEYERIFCDSVPYAPDDYHTDMRYYCGDFALIEVKNMERHYARIS